MELGRYKKKPLDFKKYIVSRPRLTFFDKLYNVFGCGPCAVSALTGISPDKISKINKDKDHFSDKLMIKFLESQKFQVIPLTVAELSNSMYVENNLTRNHLLLLSQMYTKNNASWTIILNNEYIIHNFEINKLFVDEFIQRPILTSYLLFKKSWK
jgi:hypothetical protein